MSSSTSSSRGIHSRSLVLILAITAVSVVLLNIIADAMGGDVENNILPRVTEALDKLPLVAGESDDVVIVFGSSMTEAGFGARQFDRELAERGIPGVKSFNFGFGGLNPLFQDYFSRRIVDAFEAQDKRIELVLIEFTPLQNTEGRYQGAIPSIDSYVAILASAPELWEIAVDDPTRGALLFNIKYARRGVSAEMATSFFGGEIFGNRPRPRSEIPQDEEKQAVLEEVGPLLTQAFERDYPDYDGADWSYEWQGAGTIPEERSAETLALFERYYEALRSDRRMENDKLNRIFCCDIEELPWQEELVAAFIRIVENFKQVSNHVEVFLTPRNTDWIDYPPEGRRRLDEVMERIRRETGVPVRDFQTVETITPEMFSDTTHLSRYAGDVAFTSHLVEVYAPLLAGR